MQTEIRFKNMDRSEALEDFTRLHVEPVVTEFLNRHDHHTQIWLIAEHGHSNRGTLMFSCEIDVRYPPKREVFITKSNPDMYLAVRAAIDALKVTLREHSKREIGSRQKNHTRAAANNSNKTLVESN